MREVTSGEQGVKSAPGRVLYYIETPIQLFSALCAYFVRGEQLRSSSRNLHCIIADKFSKAEEYARVLDGLGLFDEVMLVAPFPYDQEHFGINYFKDFLFRRKAMCDWFFEKYPMLEGVVYDEIVTSAMHRFISYVKCCNGQRAQTWLIEDGIGSFDGEMFAQITVLDRIVRLTARDPLNIKVKAAFKPFLNVLTRDALSYHIKGFFLFEVTDRVKRRYRNIEFIKNILPRPENEDIFNAVFPVTSEDLYKNNRFIYLSTTDLDDESGKVENSAFNLINENILEELVLRSHPRESKTFESLKGYVTDQSGDLWEMLCLKGLINDQSVLFSICSTAQLNPKLIFGYEPYLVFLYELLPDDSGFDKAVLKKTSDEVCLLYSHPERIFIPRSQNELAGLVRDLNSIIC